MHLGWGSVLSIILYFPIVFLSSTGIFSNIVDAKNKDTLFFIDKLEKNNLNVIVKLNTTNNEEHPQNSIMTAWIIRDRNLKKLEEKNKTIYKKE